MAILEDEERIVIESVRVDGRRFRPSDWIERIATIMSTFGADHRLHYSDNVQPCVIDGNKCLAVGRSLQQQNPDAFHFILKFAEDNGLRVQLGHCQQQDGLEVGQLKPSSAA